MGDEAVAARGGGTGKLNGVRRAQVGLAGAQASEAPGCIQIELDDLDLPERAQLAWRAAATLPGARLTSS